MATGQLILIVITMGLIARGLWMLALVIKQIADHKAKR